MCVGWSRPSACTGQGALRGLFARKYSATFLQTPALPWTHMRSIACLDFVPALPRWCPACPAVLVLLPGELAFWLPANSHIVVYSGSVAARAMLQVRLQ